MSPALEVKSRRSQALHAGATEAESESAPEWRASAGLPLFLPAAFGGGVVQREALDEQPVEEEEDAQAIAEAEAEGGGAGAADEGGAEPQPGAAGAGGEPPIDTGGAPPPPEEQTGAIEVQAELLVGPVDDPFEAEADGVARAVSSRAPSPDRQSPVPIRRLPDAGRSAGSISALGGSLPVGGGAPVPASVRARVEPVVGYDLGHVTVHSDHAAHAAAAGLQARAFTHRDHIWLGRGQSPSDSRLMAHELTHVVQQGSASDRRRAPPPVQRDFLGIGGALERGARWVGRQAKRGFIKIVRQVSATLAKIIDLGPVKWLRQEITAQLERLLPDSIKLPDIGGTIDAIRTTFGRVVDLVRGLLKGDPKSCQQFRDMLDTVRSIGKAIAESTPVLVLQKVLSTVGTALKTLYDLVLAPTIDFLGSILKGIFGFIKDIGDKIAGWLRSIGKILGAALDWVKEKLGFGTGEGGSDGGVIGWLKEKASAAWDYIKGPLNKVLGPLKTILKVFAAFTLPGMLYLLVKYGPTVVDSVKWLWQHWGERDMAGKAKQHNAGLGKFVETVQTLGSKVQSGVEWVAQTFGDLAEGALSLLGGLLGVPLLGFVRRGVQALADGARKLIAWVQGALRQAGQAIKTFAQRVWKVIEPYKEVLSSVIVAIASPPLIPVILAGTAWRLIPDNCVKYAILDFLLDVMIAIVAALPDTVLFGPLWPLVRRAVLGFLRRLRSMDRETKEKVSNKIAKVISGASPDFLIGFVKGVFVGIWEGITDPFKAIYMVAEGLVWVTDFFSNLAAAALDSAAKKRGGAPVTVAAAAAAAGPAPSVSDEKVVKVSPAPAPAPAAGGEAGEAGSAAAFSPDDLTQLAGEVSGVTGELSPQISTVKDNFWDALREYFGSSDGSFSDLLAKLGDYWEQIKAKMEGLGAEIAEKITAFFKTDEAESEIGYGLGWLTGTIAFQLLLDVLTGGVWAAAYPTLALIARFINWPMEVLGRVFKLIAKLGKYIVEGLKGLGSVIKKAGSGALKMVTEAFGKIGTRLGSFAEQILGRYGSKAGKAAGVAEREGAKLVKTEATKLAEQRAAATLEKRVAGEVEEQAAKKADDLAVREADQRAVRDAEERAAKGSREAAKEAAELPAALAEARVIETADEVAGLPVDAALASLDLLKTQFSWIKRFDKEPAPGGHMIWLIASKVPISHYSRPRTRAEDEAAREKALKEFLEGGGTIKKGKYMGEKSAFVEEAEEFATKHRDEVLEQLLRVQGTHRDTFFKDVIMPRLKQSMPPNTLFGTRDAKALEEALGVKLPWRHGTGPDLLVVDAGAKRISVLDLTRSKNLGHEAEKAVQAADLHALLGPGWTVDPPQDFYHKSGITTQKVLDQIGAVLDRVAKGAKP